MRIVCFTLLALSVATSVLGFGLPIRSERGRSSTVEQLSVKVYYEALCPDSMGFIRHQLYYAMMNNQWLKYTALELIPFGKAAFYENTILNKTEVFCQHGNEECELNAWHACIIENQPIEMQLELVNCMLRSENNILDQCAEKLKINIDKVKECKESRSTPEILEKYGNETAEISLSFVPSIVIDGKFDPYDQRYVLYNFDHVFCRKYLNKYNVRLINCSL